MKLIRLIRKDGTLDYRVELTKADEVDMLSMIRNTFKTKANKHIKFVLFMDERDYYCSINAKVV